jgi:hypothetical protein
MFVALVGVEERVLLRFCASQWAGKKAKGDSAGRAGKHLLAPLFAIRERAGLGGMAKLRLAG